MGKYDDIIHLPHHVSTKHPPMPLQARAAQFAPFAALSGHGDAIREAGRETDAWVEIGEDAGEELTRRLQELREGTSVRLVFFSPDKRKQGGAYLMQEGNVKRIDEVARVIELYGGVKVSIDQVFEIEIGQEKA